MRRVFAGHQLQLVWEPEDRQKLVYRTDARGRVAYVITGPGCEEVNCRLSVVSRYFHITRAERPQWLGGGASWGVPPSTA